MSFHVAACGATTLNWFTVFVDGVYLDVRFLLRKLNGTRMAGCVRLEAMVDSAMPTS